MEKFKVLIQFLLIFRQSGDVLFFLFARRFRGYTATVSEWVSSALRQLSLSTRSKVWSLQKCCLDLGVRLSLCFTVGFLHSPLLACFQILKFSAFLGISFLRGFEHASFQQLCHLSNNFYSKK